MANQRTYELTVEPRQLVGKKNRRLRKQHIVPAIVYGHNVSPESVQVPAKELEQVYHRAGSNSLIDLKIGEDGAGARKVFIHEVQRNPVNHQLTHVDFMVVNLREELTMTVPLVVVGEAPAVSRKEGVLLQGIDHVQVRALPTDVPQAIEVDVSGLEEVDQAIHVSDLNIPANVHVLTPEDELVVKITALRVEEVEEEAAEAEGEAEGGETGEATEDETES